MRAPVATARGTAERDATSGELRRSLAAGALRSRDKLDLQRMVDAFDSGVRRALERSRTGCQRNGLLETR